MQQYLLLIYIEPALPQALPTEEFNALMRDCLAHADKLQAEGTLLAAQKLQPVDTAQTLRVRDGHSRVLDGPFAETRELLAGFNLIVARDRDDAMRIARDFPWARFGSIEVRAGRHGRRARTLRRPGCGYGSSRTLISRGPTPSLPL